MESKVKEYQELYCEFEELYEQMSKTEEPIREIELEIKQIQNKQRNVDYNNPDVVIDYMETYIAENIAKEKECIKHEVDEQMAEITNSGGRVIKNYGKAVELLTRRKAEQYLRSLENGFEQPHQIDIAKEKTTTEFTVTTTLNTILSFLFRFDFLRFLPKGIRMIAAIIFWALLLIPGIFTGVYNKFKPIYDNELSDLSGYAYEMASDRFTKEVLVSSVSSIVVVIVLIVVINGVVYLAARYGAKKFLADNKVVCLSLMDSNRLKQKMYDQRVSAYMEGTVAVWKGEIEVIKNYGLRDQPESNSLAAFVRNDLYGKYSALEEKVNECKNKIENVQRQGEQVKSNLQDMIRKMKEKETEVDTLVSDAQHNHAVLSPYVSAGYSQNTVEGVKELIYFKHNYKPMLVCYGDDTAKDGERFRKNAAKLIELFMRGFFQENYHAYINMWLVDFEGLYFPESRTKGLMKVVHTEQDVQQMLEELKKTRETVDTLADGRIGTINPIRLSNRENPVKYNIVYFIGYDFTTVDRENSQLFIGGENFGFLPIVFMKKSSAQAFLHDVSSPKAFSRVVEKMKNNSQIYEFEGIVSEFEYELIISNQKRLLDEKLCVNKMMSTDEFVRAATSEEGLDVDAQFLYLDTYQLEEQLYKDIEKIEGIKLFTVNGEIPEYVTKEVIKL